MSRTIKCSVLLKDYDAIKNQTLAETSPDLEYECTVYQYCCYNYTVLHSPWCCDAKVYVYKDWYLWVILVVIIALIIALFVYFRYYQKRQLDRRIARAKLELQAHYHPVAAQSSNTHEVTFMSPDKSYDHNDLPPRYSDMPPPYNESDSDVTIT